MTSQPLRPSFLANRAPGQWAAYAVFTGVAALFAAYTIFCLQSLNETPMEAALRESGGSLFARVTGLFGQNLEVARAASVAWGFIALVLVYRLSRHLSRDWLAGAFTALGFVLFPPVMGLFALAVPQALASLVLAAGMTVAARAGAPVLRAVYTGLAAGLVSALHPVGVVAGAMLLVFAGLNWRRPVPLLIACATALVLAGVGRVVHPEAVALDALASPKFSAVMGGVVLPYGMVWVGMALALPASFSPAVAERLGDKLWALRLCPALFAAVPILSAWLGLAQGGELLAATAFGFVFGVMGVLPLVVWTRLAMPQVRSMAAWIAFPVIMYSFFWVVLGPVRADRFPYSHMTHGQGDSANSLP